MKITISVSKRTHDFLLAEKIIKEEPIWKVLDRLLNIPKEGKE